jgi:c-di-GMP-binding flagellar brake protein YcgR
MNDERLAERRTHKRYPLPASVQVEHLASRKAFPARSVDVSRGGVLMHVPAEAPFKAGHNIRLVMENVQEPQFAYLTERDLYATVTRVERKALIHTGTVAVGVAFDNPM